MAATTEVSIKTDRDGENEVHFPTDAKELVPPDLHGERLEWIRASFESFFQRVRELDSLRDFSKNP